MKHVFVYKGIYGIIKDYVENAEIAHSTYINNEVQLIKVNIYDDCIDLFVYNTDEVIIIDDIFESDRMTKEFKNYTFTTGRDICLKDLLRVLEFMKIMEGIDEIEDEEDEYMENEEVCEIPTTEKYLDTYTTSKLSILGDNIAPTIENIIKIIYDNTPSNTFFQIRIEKKCDIYLHIAAFGNIKRIHLFDSSSNNIMLNIKECDYCGNAFLNCNSSDHYILYSSQDRTIDDTKKSSMTLLDYLVLIKILENVEV